MKDLVAEYTGHRTWFVAWAEVGKLGTVTSFPLIPPLMLMRVIGKVVTVPNFPVLCWVPIKPKKERIKQRAKRSHEHAKNNNHERAPERSTVRAKVHVHEQNVHHTSQPEDNQLDLVAHSKNPLHMRKIPSSPILQLPSYRRAV